MFSLFGGSFVPIELVLLAAGARTAAATATLTETFSARPRPLFGTDARR